MSIPAIIALLEFGLLLIAIAVIIWLKRKTFSGSNKLIQENKDLKIKVNKGVKDAEKIKKVIKDTAKKKYSDIDSLINAIPSEYR